MGFLPFTPRTSPTVFGSLWASFQDYPLTHWLPRPLPLFSLCLLYHYPFHDKIPFCLFLLYTSLPHYLALWHASDGPNHLLLLLDKIPSQQDIFSKRSHGRKPNIDPFSPHHQTTSFESPWPWAHLLCIGWVQVGGALALLCSLCYLLCFSPTPFLP